mmetsp:Transcript_108208/g.345586  ORF Transcript_108208/g.345586 Transcript_108208/m.345586 type:complete len:243 (+) Transcript_108208:60-788(+)
MCLRGHACACAHVFTAVFSHASFLEIRTLWRWIRHGPLSPKLLQRREQRRPRQSPQLRWRRRSRRGRRGPRGGREPRARPRPRPGCTHERHRPHTSGIRRARPCRKNPRRTHRHHKSSAACFRSRSGCLHRGTPSSRRCRCWHRQGSRLLRHRRRLPPLFARRPPAARLAAPPSRWRPRRPRARSPRMLRGCLRGPSGTPTRARRRAATRRGRVVAETACNVLLAMCVSGGGPMTLRPKKLQ